MLDNDANLPEANEDKVDEKFPKNEVQSETDVTEPNKLTEDEGQEIPDTLLKVSLQLKKKSLLFL